MTGRLVRGDKVATPQGPATIIDPCATVDYLTMGTWAIIELEDGTRMLVRLSDLRLLDHHMDDNPKGAP